MPALITLTTEDGTQLAVRVNHAITIGRGPGNTMRTEDRNVSRYHALVARLDSGEYELRDGGSSNGTFVNGELVTQRKLQHADVLQIGDLVARFLLVPALPGDDPVVSGADAEELQGSRRRIAALLDQVADLRSAVSQAQYEEDQASRERDGVLVELRALRAEQEQLRTSHGAIEAQAAQLREENRVALARSQASVAADPGPMERRLWESSRLVESLQSQITQMNQRDAQSADARKEVARLTDELHRTRDRLAATNEVLKTAMERIAALNDEVSRLRVE